MNAKLVEAVARAQYEVFGRAWRLKWDELAPKGQKTMYRECARAALAAIEAEGFAVVRPTEEAWHAWISVNHEYDPTTQHARFHGDIGNWRACWAKAVAKAKEQP